MLMIVVVSVLTLGSKAGFAQPYLSISDVSALEGDSGTKNFNFTVTLSPPSSETVTVEYRDIWYGGASPADSPEDYMATSGMLTFSPGTTTQTITVQVNGDTKVEDDEAFGVWIENPTNASFLSVLDQLGTGIIENDDLPILSITGVRAIEGDNGTKDFNFTVTLSESSSQTITVEYSTNDDSAIAPGDYIAKSGTLIFNPETTIQTITVKVYGDKDIEDDEAFVVSLDNPSNAILSAVTFAEGIIENDDLPILSISNVVAMEGNIGITEFKFSVTLSEPSSKTVTVDYSTDNDSATTPEDYIATSGTLIFSPGTTTQTFIVQIRGDAKAEVDEYFEIWLDNATNAVLINNLAVGTIKNDDTATIPTLSIFDVTSAEGDSGTKDFIFEVNLSGPTSEIVTVQYFMQDDLATSPNDYLAVSGMLIFSPSTTSQMISVQVNGDRDVETDETFRIVLYNPTNATISDDFAIGTIRDDDMPGGQGNIIYVDPDAQGNNDGLSWSNAYPCLQNALEVASNGDEIRVAEGIYKPDQRLVDLGGRQGYQIVASGDRETTFQLINGVILKGGYAGFNESDPDIRDIKKHTSILSGDLAGDDVTVDTLVNILTDSHRVENSYCIVQAVNTDATAILDGFTLTGANATERHDKGGGMDISNGSPTVLNCTFTLNSAMKSGGGIYIGGSSNPTLTLCTFINNLAVKRGGGIENEGNVTLTNCSFIDNESYEEGGGGIDHKGQEITIKDCSFTENRVGGGIYIDNGLATIANCEFNANSTQGYGGGLYIEGNSETSVSNCVFTGNSAAHGGAINISGDTKSIILTNNEFVRNSAQRSGGAFAGGTGVQLINCTFVGNSAESGGGMSAGSDSFIALLLNGPTVLDNCIFTDNQVSDRGGGLDGRNCKLVDCIFNNNFASQRGGGMDLGGDMNPELKNCIFRQNSTSGFGGGTYIEHECNAVFSKCMYNNNSAGQIGGGIHSDGANSKYVLCTFIKNSAGNGGGIGLYWDDTSEWINCTFTNNVAWDQGGGVDIDSGQLLFSNCIFVGNSAKSTGAISNRGECVLTNCTITANVAKEQVGGIYSYSNLSLVNCILWNNSIGDESPNLSSQLFNTNSTISYCCIQGWIEQDNNINANPLFVSDPYDGGDGWADDPQTPDINEAANNDYGILWLRPESPCINAGDSSELPADTLDIDGDEDIVEPIPYDLDGALRILGQAVDIGAYEHHKDFVIYVDDDAPGANNGNNWQNAYNHLQDALDSAESAVKPVVILVAEGVYTPDQGINQTPGDRTATFNLINWVILKGGYAGFNAPDPNSRDTNSHKSILSGDLDRNDISVTDPLALLSESTRSENNYHVVNADGVDYTAVLDGFTIIAGNADGFGDYNKGGGFYIYNSNPTISNCTLASNSAIEGAGIYNEQSTPAIDSCAFQDNAALAGAGLFNDFSNPNLTDCNFKTNFAKENGAAVYNANQSAPEFVRCVFMDNKSNGHGGAIQNDNSNPILKDCSITKNIANSNGGGVCNTVSNPTLIECKFTKNSAELGGGIYNDQSAPIITNCVFNQNISDQRGGGIFNSFVSSPVITNCRFGQNRAGLRGGGLHNHASSASVINCTFTNNIADWEGGGICNVESKLTLSNCILWGNNAETWAQIRSYGTTVNLIVSHCVIQEDLPIGIKNQVSSTAPDGNLDINPNLTADYHIQPGSPCIDAGDNNAIPTDSADLDGDLDLTEPTPIDIDADSRFADDPNIDDTGIGTTPIVDIGADEFIDNDNDSLPDWWERKYFGDALIAEPDDDPDMDYLTNLEEYNLYSSNPIAEPILVDISSGPYRTIQDGIDAANDGDTVLVVAGTYTGEGNRNIDFKGKSVVLKAFNGPEVTILDCEGQTRGFNFHSGEGPSAAIVGMTITHGQADYGGAVYCERSHPQLRNCIIENNDDPNHEIGGLYGYLSNPTLADCTILDNTGDGIHVDYGSIRIYGTVQLLSEEWSGRDVMLFGNGNLEMSSDSILLLDQSRIRCNILGAGTIQVGLKADLVIEKEAVIDLGAEEQKGTIECHGLLRVKDNAQIRNVNINISRVSFEGDVNVFNSVIIAEAGAPYGQFSVEDSVIISGNEIHADGDRYMDMDRSIFDGLIENNKIYITITEGKDQTRGGLFELRGRDGLVSNTCGLDEFLCKVNPDSLPAFDPNSWIIEELHLVDWAKLNLTNRFDFQPPFDSGGESEVLYVKNLILDEGAILNTAFNRIYYENMSLAETAIIKNIPLLGFSLNIIAFNDDIEFLARVSHNNFEHPVNRDFDRTHVKRVTGIEPDPQGMMRMCTIKDSDPESALYGEVINARAKGLFAKSDEDQILVLFEYLFETSEPGTELVIYLSDVSELLDSSDLFYKDHYLEVGRLTAPPAGRPGSVDSGRFGTFYQYVSRDHLNFIKGTRIELELIGPDGASVLINNWDPQVHCDGICMDLNWSDAADEEDFLIVISESGTTAGLLDDGTGSRACLDGVFSTDGFVDTFDVASWDWALSDQDHVYSLNFCRLPLIGGINTMSLASVDFKGSDRQISVMGLPDPLSDLLIAGKRNSSEDPLALKSKDRLYTFDREFQSEGWFDTEFERCGIRLVRGSQGEIYQINSATGIVRLDKIDEVIIPPGQTTYTNEPRYKKSATVYIGIQDGSTGPFGRPILDAAFDTDYVYVVPVIVSPDEEDVYLAVAKLQLLDRQNPPYQVVQIYDDPPEPNDNRHLDNLREIEIDDDGNVYVINVNSLNESDILWKYDSTSGNILNRLDLGNPNGDIYLPDPIAMHVSEVTGRIYITSGQSNEETYATVIYGFSKENLVLERSVIINGMHHVTGITEDPSTGTLWVVGFNITDIPDYPDPTQQPFYYPCLANVSSNGESVELRDLLGTSDLGLPMSIVWTGIVNDSSR